MSISFVRKVVWCRWCHPSLHVRHGCVQSEDERQRCPYLPGDSQGAVRNSRPCPLHNLCLPLHPDRLWVLAPFVRQSFLGYNRLLSPVLSWRVCDSQCAHGNRRQRGVFLAANWDRGLRHFRRSTCDVHL